MYSLRYYIDSWIEVSSQPSSSSLSSAATNDDIITTGLRVQRSTSDYQRSRRRRGHLANVSTAQAENSPREPGSSQDEYEESESESDRVLSSSNEDIGRQPLGTRVLSRSGPPSASDPGPSSDEDDTSTALGMRITSSPFVPQPNAFSHPPVTHDPSWTRAMDTNRSEPTVVGNSRMTTRRNSFASTRSGRRRQQHSPYNMISPSHRADNDAALRASLSTLLSCAHAARGLPKSEPPPSGNSPQAQPSSFRLVPESVAMGEEDSHAQPEPSPNHTPPSPRIKRRSSSSRDRCSQSSSTCKKTRRTSMTDSQSPTVMTWVISAGVVVLFSAISFSAGYMLGREVGKTETGTGIGSVFGDGAANRPGCGQDTVRGSLKRLRWGTAAAGSGMMS